MREHTDSLNTLTQNYHALHSRVGIMLPVLSIFFLTFIAGGFYNYYYTFSNAHTLGQQAITKLETYINKSAHDLDRLRMSISGQCDDNDVVKLRNYVFLTDKIKEVGAYNQQGRIFCTSNAGKSNIKIYDQILERLEQSPQRTTISLTHSTIGLPSFFIYTSILTKQGIDALIPPRHFLELISPLFNHTGYGYRIQVLHHVIQGNMIDESETNRHLNFSSSSYPFAISVDIGRDAYINHYVDRVWFLILIASLLTVTYLIVRDYAQNNHSLDSSLRSAIQQNQLKLYLQPIVNSKQHHVVGCEALLRWNDPEKGYISPTIFIPLAEQIGIIKDLTYRVLEYLTDYAEKHKRELDGRYISINISRILVLDDEFISHLYDYAITHPRMVQTLLLEITEDNDYSSSEMEQAVHNLSLLRHLGFKMAIDDFGTGYSGLNFIHQHPFDKIKIDQVFIRGLSQNEALDSVVVSMIELANQLGMLVIAEGVENVEQLDALEKMGVEYIQGFYFAQPMPAEEFIGYIKASERAVY